MDCQLHRARWHLQREGERLVAPGLNIEYAQGTADDLLRRLGSWLARQEADWRQRPPSERQVAVLSEFGLPVPSSQGEASDLLTMTFAHRASEPATSAQRLRTRKLAVCGPQTSPRRSEHLGVRGPPRANPVPCRATMGPWLHPSSGGLAKCAPSEAGCKGLPGSTLYVADS